MTTVRIESADTRSPGAVVEIYQRGSGGQADLLVEKRLLGSAADFSVSATGYLVVREATESDAKTIDNWSETPPAGDQG